MSDASKFPSRIDMRVNPKNCGERLEAFKAELRTLERAYSKLHRAWDAELKRRYGYEWIPFEAAAGPEELERAQVEFLEAEHAFSQRVSNLVAERWGSK